MKKSELKTPERPTQRRSTQRQVDPKTSDLEGLLPKAPTQRRHTLTFDEIYNPPKSAEQLAFARDLISAIQTTFRPSSNHISIIYENHQINLPRASVIGPHQGLLTQKINIHLLT